MKQKNVFSEDLCDYLNQITNLKIREQRIERFKRIFLRKKPISAKVVSSTSHHFPNEVGEYDMVRLEMFRRLSEIKDGKLVKEAILTNPSVVAEVKKQDYPSTKAFMDAKIKEITENKIVSNATPDKPYYMGISTVLKRAEDVKVRESGKMYIGRDIFRPVGRIGESEINQAITVDSTLALVKSFSVR